jgi:acyl-ACP thioesterase
MMPEKRFVFSVTTYNCNAEGELHLFSLMQQLQEIASKHAEDLGVGRKWMEENGFYWVLVNFKINFIRHPQYGETVILKTWPSGWDLLKAFRDFKGEDLQGNELFSATSDWMVIDRSSIRPMTTKELKFDFESIVERNIQEMKRLKGALDMEEVTTIVVPYSSIDMNRHVNNTEYVRWGIDTMRVSTPSDRHIASFTISFMAEVFKDEELLLKRKDLDVDKIMVVGTKFNNGKDAFVMEIGFQ